MATAEELLKVVEARAAAGGLENELAVVGVRTGDDDGVGAFRPGLPGVLVAADDPHAAHVPVAVGVGDDEFHVVARLEAGRVGGGVGVGAAQQRDAQGPTRGLGLGQIGRAHV